MATFLFWNVQRKHLDSHIVALVKNHSVDVLLLLEHPKPDIALFHLLNQVRPYQRVTTHNRFGVYVSFNSTQMVRVKSVGGKLTRSVLGVSYRFFCNPMWSCFRGWERSPPGTHYFNGGDAHEVFWHMIDQVVLRPQALHMFSERNLKILTEAGSARLLTRNGLPNAQLASDHLPVIFKLNLNA